MAAVMYAVKNLMHQYPDVVVLSVSLAVGLLTYGLFFMSNKKETPLELKQILLSSIYKKYRKV